MRDGWVVLIMGLPISFDSSNVFLSLTFCERLILTVLIPFVIVCKLKRKKIKWRVPLLCGDTV